MMKKTFPLIGRISFLIFILVLTAGLISTARAETTEYEAALVAKHFLDYMKSEKSIVLAEPVKSNLLDVSKPEIHAGWILHLSEGGYILVSPSRNHSPIKAYSLHNDFGDLPPRYRAFLKKELELYARLESCQTGSTRRTSQQYSSDSVAGDAWSFLLEYDPADRSTEAYTEGSCLLTTKWDQGYPYNKFLPSIDNEKAPAGCVNVALAQVMKFHEFPASGTGTVRYEWEGRQLETILSHPYYWSNMPDSLNMTTPSRLQDEIGILMRDLAIVNQTAFGLNGSNTYLRKNDFIRHFGYSDRISTLSNTNKEEFFSKLQSQIDLEQPVLLSFPGHMTVVDGYTFDSTGDKFHVNMGWGGLDNEYYYLDRKVQTSYYEFTPELSMVYNIKPCSGDDCVSADPPSADIPPEFITELEPVIIENDAGKALKTRLDIRDANGDDLSISAILSNSETVTADIENDILSIQPVQGSRNKAVKIRVSARAGGKSAEKDFLVLVADKSITFGEHQTTNGDFDSQADENTHQAILEGECAINGDRDIPTRPSL